MDKVFTGWTKFIDFVQENGIELMKNPVIWMLLILAVIGIYGLFRVSDQVRENGIGGIFRQFLQVFLDTTGDLLNALRSLTGFIGVLQMLLFGKLNNRTLYILINYAIIFLSMASFTTTFLGLDQIMQGPLAAFVSFGVQVTILICITKIGNIFFQNGKSENIKVYVRYYFNNDIEDNYSVCSKRFNKQKNDEKNLNDNSEMKISGWIKKLLTRIETAKYFWRKIKGKKKIVKIIKKIKKILLLTIALVALLMSVSISSFFSYLNMFEKFVVNQLNYDDHFRSISVTQEISNEYSKDISTYMSELTQMLSEYNDNVEEWTGIIDDNPIIMEQNLQNKAEEIEAKEEEYNRALLAYESAEDGTDEEDVAEHILDEIEKELENMKSEYATLERTMLSDDEYQNKLMAYKNILILTDFYGNHLYFMNENNDVSKVRESFTYLQQAEASLRKTTENGEHAKFDDEKAVEVLKAFENYVLLNEYFSKNEKAGLNFEEINLILEEIEYDNSMSEDEYQRASKMILEKMIEIMTEIPLLDSVKNVWTDENITVPSQASYLEKIYDLYRDNSGTTSDFERAYNKLLGKNNEKATLARELAFVALAIDLSIIWLSLLRSKNQSMSNISELERLEGILLLDDSISRENERIWKGQGFGITIGILGGVLVYILYRMSESGQDISTKTDIFSFVFFTIMGLAIGLLVYRIYRSVLKRGQNWKEEALYLKVKEILVKDTDNEKMLEERIEKLRKGGYVDPIDIDQDDIRNIERMWKDDNVQELFNKFFYKDVLELMKHLEMKECTKTTFIRKMKKQKTKKIDCYHEKLILPCLSERLVQKYDMKAAFSVLYSNHLIGFDFIKEGNWKQGVYILPKRFWSILYDAVLLRIVGGRLSDYNIEEVIHNNGEDEEDF